MSSDSSSDDPTPGPGPVVQEAIDAASAAYAGDTDLDLERTFRTELTSRGLDVDDDAWISGVVEDIRRGREPVVGEHDGSVDPADG
jgi:hypothetical protein